MTQAMRPLQFGEITVEAITDGYLDLSLSGFFPKVPADAWQAYPNGIHGDTLRCPMTTFVIRSGLMVALVDTGLGPWLGNFRGVSGQLPASLAAAGIKNEDVNAVISTHLHPDHVGWNCTEVDGVYHPTFPNAAYVINRPEWVQWADVAAGYIRRHVLPLAESGQLSLVDDGHEPLPGVRLISTPGHTSGHVSVLVYGAGAGAVITGDAAHHPAEIEHPNWSPSADDDPELSARSRARLIERVEQEGLIVLGGHFPAPHAGRIIRVEQRRVYQPLQP